MARSTFFASDHADAPRGPARRLKIGHPRKMPAGLHFRPLAVFFPLSRLRRRGRSSATSRCSENFCGCLRTRSKAAFAGSFGCRRMATDRNRAKPGVVSGGLAVLLGVTALVLWTSRAYLAAQFASSYGLTVGLLIQNDSDRPQSVGGCELRSEIRSEEHTSELQSHVNLVCRLLLEKKKKKKYK